MDRGSILTSLGRATALGVALGAIAGGCAGSGPPIVEHPRSASMTLVSPERDPLAGAITLPPPSSPQDAPRALPPRQIAARRVPLHRSTRTTLHVADYSLALGPVEARAAIAPAIAFSAAMSMSTGPAPRLAPTTHAVVVPIPSVAVEEGAWEEQRR